LRRISTASLNLRANPKGGTLNLAVIPSFAERWLAPRLPRFARGNPHIMVNIMTLTAPIDFRQEPFDGAIHFGTAGWEGSGMAALRRETVTPLCSPALRKKYNFTKPADLQDAPLLHLTTRPDAWERWFLFNGHNPESVHGPLFDQFSTMAQAAIAGLGLVLLPSFLFAREIEEGVLVPALNLPMQSTESYFLTWPLDRATYVPLLAFRDWLLAEVQRERDGSD
jgi:LysR family glycine cleavage system transcriptional activator